MKILCLILALVMLTGCVPAEPAAATVGIAAATEEAMTAPPTTVPPPPPTTEPADPVLELLSGMSIPEKVGQLFLARCPGEAALADIKAYHLGGYILFAEDLLDQTPESLTQKLQSYQEHASIPMLIAVDEEGGTVCRISAFRAFRDSEYPSPRSLYQEGGLDRVLDIEAEKAFFLHTLGINVNMAPVCDITTDPGAFMYRRSLGQDPETVGKFAIGAMELMGAFQVGAVLKHFPGYGNNADTHTGIAVDDRSLDELEERDLIPFSMGIDAGCGAILVSHTIVNAMDATLPATLSPAVHSYIRSIMGFQGVIVTDDLYMDAIRETYGPGEAAVLAVLAGNDLLCSTEYTIQYQAVLEAVESGRISVNQLDTAAERVLRWKQQLGLIE